MEAGILSQGGFCSLSSASAPSLPSTTPQTDLGHNAVTTAILVSTIALPVEALAQCATVSPRATAVAGRLLRHVTAGAVG
jgi:hypothetical protein